MHYLAEAGLGLLMLMYALHTFEVALYTWVSVSVISAL